MRNEQCNISCACGYQDEWEQFAVVPGLFRCPECKREWRLSLEDGEAASKTRPCPFCGDAYEYEAKLSNGKTYIRKTCGKTPCLQAQAYQTRQESNAGKMSPAQARIFAGMQAEMGKFQHAGMCPV
ncbi:hypothetical protein SAMN05660653_00155 [Desulfonatronum thiosulfatophilum]|uniref:Uncharacterized protein n=1 Tax=Desulfonatronum thiosulfatophilum TaxID=617002 RepID=A0A1G6A4X3_9BACT|nr:hypothetical protein [Desulfonatronum thiosulfatophilum]SDB03482.1 hypothetical protein SAMN05660653_00155 [Desulfonatronum thiosulfatophilum]